jgi:hypothetical protein
MAKAIPGHTGRSAPVPKDLSDGGMELTAREGDCRSMGERHDISG